jgi:hypothetical protein
MRQLRPLGFMIAVMLFGAAHVGAQCTPAFTFSVYIDGSVSADDSTVYSYTSFEDTSTLCTCTHSGYTAVAYLYDPSGTVVAGSSESGFSASASAPTNGVSGTYEASGVALAYCSCFGGEVGGGGTDVPLTVECPQTITISSTFDQLTFNFNVSGNYPTFLTGFGIVATMQVGPGSLDGATVTENVTLATSSCRNYNVSSPPPDNTPAPDPCTPAAPNGFLVGPGGGGSLFGINFPASGSNQFDDYHLYGLSWDLFWQYSLGTTCTVTCAQTYYACGKAIGSFTITDVFTHSSYMGAPVTDVAITKQ